MGDDAAPIDAPPPPRRDRHAPLVWAALLVPLWTTMVLCTHWEPILRDSWGHYFRHVDWDAAPHGYWAFLKWSVLHNNPRFGQLVVWLAFVPGPWHAIVTPLLELAPFFQLFALVVGRWPSLRRRDDALMLATIIALIAATAPELGPMLFYRPYTYNYVLGLVVTLAVAIPYRRHLEHPTVRSRWWIPLMFVAGTCAGFANEHTSPALLLGILAACAACARSGLRVRGWMIAGGIGVVAGAALLFFAPGQSERYAGLATQTSMLGRLAARGLVGSLGVIFTSPAYAWKMLAWVAIGVVAWRRRPRGTAADTTRARIGVAIACALAGIAIDATLVLSPKLGTRLYFSALTLFAAAVAGLAVPQVLAARGRVIKSALWALNAVAIGWMVVQCLRIYSTVGPEAADRMYALEHAPKDTTLLIKPFTMHRSRWFLGDDLVAPNVRKWVANDFGLTDVQFDRAVDPTLEEPQSGLDRAGL